MEGGRSLRSADRRIARSIQYRQPHHEHGRESESNESRKSIDSRSTRQVCYVFTAAKDRPAEDLEKALPQPDKPLPEISETIVDVSRLSLQQSPTIDQETRRALTNPRIFETVPAVVPSFILIVGVLLVLCSGKTTRRSREPFHHRSPRIPPLALLT